MSLEDDNETGFLSRWSRRKLTPDEKQEEQQQAAEQPASEPEDVAETVSDEQQPPEDKPVWQRDDVDEDTKKAALRALFHRPEFNDRCRLNEYDDDFTQFKGLGDIVTHEMKRALRLAEEKTRPVDESDEQPQSASADNQAEPEQDKEDNGLA